MNIEASNGVIHKTKEVLTPPAESVGTIAETVIAVSSTGGADDNPMDFDILLADISRYTARLKIGEHGRRRDRVRGAGGGSP